MLYLPQLSCFQSGGPPVRQVLIDEGVPGGAPRAVHARVNELRGGRSKEREKSHFQQSVSNTHLDKVPDHLCNLLYLAFVFNLLGM